MIHKKEGIILVKTILEREADTLSYFQSSLKNVSKKMKTKSCTVLRTPGSKRIYTITIDRKCIIL